MHEKLDLYVGKRVRWRRRLLGLSQSELADLVGVRYQQIQKYECAVNRLSAARLWHLARALGVNVQYFYEGWVDEQSVGEPQSAAEQNLAEQPSHEQQASAPQSQAA